MENIKLLIVDDHPIVREGLKLIFETVEEIEIKDEATNGEEALALLKQNEYDLILLDISMPVMNGLDFLKEKERINNNTEVVVLTTGDDRDIINKVLLYKVRGFLLKDAQRKEMIQVVLEVSSGKTIISSEIEKIMSKENIEKNIIKETNKSILTEKEIIVINKVVKGAASKEIAIEMGITERTVKAHLTNIYRKLEVNSRSEAVALAIIRKIVLV